NRNDNGDVLSKICRLTPSAIGPAPPEGGVIWFRTSRLNVGYRRVIFSYYRVVTTGPGSVDWHDPLSEQPSRPAVQPVRGVRVRQRGRRAPSARTGSVRRDRPRHRGQSAPRGGSARPGGPRGELHVGRSQPTRVRPGHVQRRYPGGLPP